MITTNKALWLRLIGWAVLIHVILIAMSILEVFIYSAVINPGQEQSFYNEHAQISAPYVSIIIGIILFFIISRLLAKKWLEKRIVIALALPIAYIILDLIMLIPYNIDWNQHYLVFTLSFGSKLLAAFVGVMTIGSEDYKTNRQ